MKGPSTAISIFLASISCSSAFAQSAEAIQNESGFDTYGHRSSPSYPTSSVSQFHYAQSTPIAPWVQSQLLLFFLSCLLCVVLYYAAPQLISNSTATLSIKPLKSLTAGAAVSCILALTLISSSMLNQVHALEPLSAAINLSVCFLLFTGFLTFSASLPKILPARFTRKPKHLIKSTLPGLIILSCLNIALGLVGAGGDGIVLDLLFSIVGLGALTVTVLEDYKSK